MKNQLRDKGLFVQLWYTYSVLIWKGDLEFTFIALGVNVNCNIFKVEGAAILQKEYSDPLNIVEPWHDQPPCKSKGETRQILRRKDRIETENEGQSIWQYSWYIQAAQKMQGKLSLQGWRRILFD